MELTRARLADLLHYDPETGIFTWTKPRRGVRVGREAGRLSVLGYREIGVDYVLRRANRLAFLYMTGDCPECDIDHINRDKADNRWVNLRPATRSQNTANTGLRTINTSGVIGVVWEPKRGKWRAQIHTGGRTKNLGRFAMKEDAAAAYAAAAAKYFGEFVPDQVRAYGDQARNAAGVPPAP